MRKVGGRALEFEDFVDGDLYFEFPLVAPVCKGRRVDAALNNEHAGRCAAVGRDIHTTTTRRSAASAASLAARLSSLCNRKLLRISATSPEILR